MKHRLCRLEDEDVEPFFGGYERFARTLDAVRLKGVVDYGGMRSRIGRDEKEAG